MRVTAKMMHDFAHDLEARVPFMYLDAHEPDGLVTTGLGNLIEPIELALHLPWVEAGSGPGTGRPADEEHVRWVWNGVKSLEEYKHQHLDRRSDRSLILTDDAIDELVLQRLQSNHAILRQRWPAIDTWPIDAELFAHSWAWAVGPNSAYPKMSKCLRARDFGGAMLEATINPKIGTIPERNRRNQILLANAAYVELCNRNPRTPFMSFDELHWPTDLSAEATR